MSTAIITEIPAFVTESSESYHSDTSRVSRSQLVDFIESPWLYYKRHVQRDPAWQKEPSKEMEFGTLFHAAVLEGAAMEDMVHVIPDEVLNVDGHRKGGTWLKWKNTHDDKPQVKAAELDTPKAMMKSLSESKAAMLLLAGEGDVERTAHWDYDGIKLRTRLDKLTANQIVDLKTARSCDLAAINNSLEGDGYYLQAAFYQMAVEAVIGERLPFRFIFVEKSVPFRTAVVEIDQDWIDQGRNEVEFALRRLQRCANTGDWKDPIGDSVISMNRPKWADYKWTLTESE